MVMVLMVTIVMGLSYYTNFFTTLLHLTFTIRKVTIEFIVSYKFDHFSDGVYLKKYNVKK